MKPRSSHSMAGWIYTTILIVLMVSQDCVHLSHTFDFNLLQQDF